MQARQIAGKAGDDNAVAAGPNGILQTVLHGSLGATGAGHRGVGRVADDDINPGAAELLQSRLRGQLADHRVVIQLPVAAVVQALAGDIQHDGVGLRNRVGDRNPFGLKGTDAYGLQRTNLLQAWPGQARVQLGANQLRGKRAGVDRAIQRAPDVRNRADVVLVAVGDQQRRQLDIVPLQRRQARHRYAVAPAGRRVQREAAIHRNPFPARAVKIEVRPKHACATERHKPGAGLAVELVEAWGGHADLSAGQVSGN